MKQKILIADDDPSIVTVVSIILEEQGYEPLSFGTTHDVVYHAIHDKPKLILMDLWMSGVDGGEVTQTLKKNAVTKHIPIIIMSARNDIADIAKATGASDFLPKPFDIEDLIAIIARHIQKG